MSNPPFRIEPLAEAHERAAFDCGEPVLNRYFQTQATQDISRHVANCFIAVETATSLVAAFYTLSTVGIPFVDHPP